MSEEKENTTIVIFGKFGVPKPLFYGLLIAMITGAISLSYAFITTTSQTNKEVPTQEKKINAVDAKTTALLSKDSAKTIQFILMKDDINGLTKTMDEGFKAINKRLDEINRNTK